VKAVLLYAYKMRVDRLQVFINICLQSVNIHWPDEIANKESWARAEPAKNEQNVTGLVACWEELMTALPNKTAVDTTRLQKKIVT